MPVRPMLATYVANTITIGYGDSGLWVPPQLVSLWQRQVNWGLLSLSCASALSLPLMA